MTEINEIVEITRPLEFEFENFPIKCEIAINAASSKFVKSLDDEQYIDVLCKSAAQVLRKIDITIKGKQVECTAEGLEELPMRLIIELNNQISSMLENEKKKSSNPTPST
jgi:ribosome-associated translation inhibitor RaiA